MIVKRRSAAHKMTTATTTTKRHIFRGVERPEATTIKRKEKKIYKIIFTALTFV